MNGFLVVDKPAGITSHDVIARCRRILGEKRIGHAGTLDPMATGVLIVGVGKGARLLRFVESAEKGYEALVVFGATTATLDAEGELRSEHDASALQRAEVERALEPFRGDIMQVPPMVSAIKVGGERLYAKARRGEEVEREPRRVTIRSLELLSFEPGVRATARLAIVCSKGTYIRTLGADLGSALGVGAHLGALRRTRVGPFVIEDAVPLDDVSAGSLRPMGDAVAGYPRRAVDEDSARALVQGKPMRAAGIKGPYAIWGPDGLVAMAEDRGEVARTLCVVAES